MATQGNTGDRRKRADAGAAQALAFKKRLKGTAEILAKVRPFQHVITRPGKLCEPGGSRATTCGIFR